MTAITVCVPVYNAAAFVSETMEHIAAQTFRDFKVLVSIDRGDDDSESVCRRMLSDPRFEVVTQSMRLGWVGNVNALIARVDTPFFCITPHDDLLDPRYLEVMHNALTSEPSASCAYSDIQGFGTMQPVISQPAVRGSRIERVLDVLLNHYSAVTFRGLVRRRNEHDHPYLPTGIPRDFAADAAWTMRLVLRGELLRIPELLYRKRYDDTSVHAGWSQGSRAEQLGLYAAMVAMCTRLALEEITDSTERDEVLAAGLLRASGHTAAGGCAIPSSPLEIARAVADYVTATRDLGPLPDVDKVLAHTKVAVLRDAPDTHVSFPDPGASALAARVLRKARSLIGGG
jgi:glycosyltransferase involved in cell wall biosynthesis